MLKKAQFTTLKPRINETVLLRKGLSVFCMILGLTEGFEIRIVVFVENIWVERVDKT